ncbi:MAG: TRAP transporter substrate-binding protein DctP [Deltaproteobacteria bacterium]|nr:TRAP transporter substrate-binding protein DctP [Deltaproteobacteria bacterium]
MKTTKSWIIVSFVFLFLIGIIGMSWAASAAEPTRDSRTYFGYDVEGLEPVTIVWSSDAPLNSYGDAAAIGAKLLIEAESKGKIKIDLHRHSSLYGGRDIPRVLPIGTIDIGGINKGSLMSREIGYAPWVIGYVWKSPEHLMAVPCSPEWFEMEDKLAKDKWNLKPLALSAIGNWDYFSKKPFNSMKDFRGKKVWSYGQLSNAYIAAWGATPVGKSTSEMYMSYYKGGLDIISFTLIGYLHYKFIDCGKYYINMPVYPPGAIGIHYVMSYMNRDKWKSLPTAYKKIILDTFDLACWFGIWEILCQEKLGYYRLVNEKNMVDCGISTKHPEEYEKIKTAAVEAGRKFVIKAGATQEQWDEAQSILKKYADPKYTSQYGWWFKLAWAEADRRLEEIKKSLKAGKSWDDAYLPFEFKRCNDWNTEQFKKAWLDVPRVKWEWNEATRLQN